MDATTHVHIATTEAYGHQLDLDIMCDSGGQHSLFIKATERRDGRKRETLIGFGPVEWSRFKGAVLAMDRAVAQLRHKGLIFEFGPVLSDHEIPEPRPGELKAPGEYRVKFIAEKMTADGVKAKECATLDEVSVFVHETE